MSLGAFFNDRNFRRLSEKCLSRGLSSAPSIETRKKQDLNLIFLIIVWYDE